MNKKVDNQSAALNSCTVTIHQFIKTTLKMQSSTSIAHMILLLLFFVPIYATSSGITIISISFVTPINSISDKIILSNCISDFSLIEVDRYYPFNTSLTVFVKDNKTLGINSKSDWQCLRIYCDDESPSKKKLGQSTL